MLTKLSSACMGRPTNAMPSTKLLSAIEGLNAPVWPLIRSGFIAILSRKQQIKKMLKRRTDAEPNARKTDGMNRSELQNTLKGTEHGKEVEKRNI